MTQSVLDQPSTRYLRADFDHAWLKSSLVMIMTMRADDAKRWDADSMVELARSFSLGALGFSVGGVTAFYPTAVEGHPVSPSLGGRDLVGQTVEALHRAGIRAIGRIDPSLGSREALERFPDRFARDADGQPVRLHDFYLTCLNGAHYGEFMLKVVREIVERYPLDGLWANAAQFAPWGTARCYCENCVRLFREECGDAFPKEDWNDPAWKRYNEWRYARVADWNQRVKAVIVATRPSCAWLPLSQVIESWDHTRTGGWDVDLTSPHADGVVLEAQRNAARGSQSAISTHGGGSLTRRWPRTASGRRRSSPTAPGPGCISPVISRNTSTGAASSRCRSCSGFSGHAPISTSKGARRPRWL
jgi:hypothetical protein